MCPEILDTKIYDRICTVAEEEAYAAARLLARREGILTGITSGAAPSGRRIKELTPGK